MFTNAECRNRYHRIIRRLSADKRHETEIETLKLVCNRDAAGPSLLPSLTDEGKVLDVAGSASSLASTSRRASSSSIFSSCISGGEDLAAGSTSSIFLNQGVQKREEPMLAMVQQMMTNEHARGTLMQLAETIVSVSHTLNQDQSPQPTDSATRDDGLFLTHWLTSVFNSNSDAAGMCDTSMLGVSNTSTTQVGEKAWSDVLGLSNCEAMSTPTTTSTTLSADSSVSPTAIVSTTAAAADFAPMISAQNYTGNVFDSSMRNWTDACLSQAWICPNYAPNNFSSPNGVDTGSNNLVGSRQSLDAVTHSSMPSLVHRSSGWWG